MTEGGHEAVRTDDQVVAAAEARELKRQIRDWNACWAKRRWGMKSPGGFGAREWLAITAVRIRRTRRVQYAQALGLIPCFTPVHSP
jgi:hypothetical protein